MKRFVRLFLLITACSFLAACTHGIYHPDRKPYDGFRWEHISGAGLDLWAQSSDRLRIVTDSTLPGAVLVNGAGLRLDTILRVFQPNGALPDSLIALLRRQPGWDESQTAVLKEITSPWKGRRRYVIARRGIWRQHRRTDADDARVVDMQRLGHRQQRHEILRDLRREPRPHPLRQHRPRTAPLRRSIDKTAA